MLSQKNQALDTWTLLQVSQIQLLVMYVGDNTGFTQNGRTPISCMTC